jgi:hypothetical protein
MTAALKTIRLELARTKENPEGRSDTGYEFSAPLTADGHLDAAAWKSHRADCKVRRFFPGEKIEQGALLHLGPDRWVFSYEKGAADDEPAFRFDRHLFKPGEYVSITEHDGITRTFKVVSVR